MKSSEPDKYILLSGVHTGKSDKIALALYHQR